MKIALCQIDTTVGDFSGNTRKILSAGTLAAARGADLAVFPELAIPGYPPKDLLLRSDFVESAGRALSDVSRKTPLALVVGTILPNTSRVGKSLYNVAAFVRRKKSPAVFARKMLIPSYDVFDESRYFEPAARPVRISFGGMDIGLSICEDVWNDETARSVSRQYSVNPVKMLMRSGIDVLLNLSASPFELGKPARRFRMISRIARKYRRPVVQVNLVGGNDELLFDGNSIAVDAGGRLRSQGKAFREDMQMFDLGPASVPYRGRFRRAQRAEEAYESLVMGTRDYARKTGFRSAVLGLSGGIDSSVTACIAAAALGPSNVLGVLMPGPYSSRGSVRDAEALVRTLGIRSVTVRIDPLIRAFRSILSTVFKGLPADVTEENLQARIRGVILMALSNKFGHLLLTTGNKSELSVGYCTLYGDMCGGLAVISDTPKMLVYAVGRHINRSRRIIPEAVFTKPPSAELRPNQTDQDTLPPYPVLDAFVDDYVEKMRPAGICGPAKLTLKERRELAKKIDMAEYKRRQAAPGLRLTPQAFGYGRRHPIARK